MRAPTLLMIVLWIRDILVRVRITDLGSASGSGSFRQGPSRYKKKKKYFFNSFFAYYFLKVTVLLHHSSKTKSHEDVTKQKKSRFFLLFLLNDGRIRIQIRIRTNNDGSTRSGRPKNIRRFTWEGRKSQKNLDNFKVIEANIRDEDSVRQGYPDQELFAKEPGPTICEIYDKLRYKKTRLRFPQRITIKGKSFNMMYKTFKILLKQKWWRIFLIFCSLEAGKPGSDA